jgi:hypothetical protein
VQVLQEKAKGIQQILSCTQMQCSSTSWRLDRQGSWWMKVAGVW